MTKQELKTIYNDTWKFLKNGELVDDKLIIIGKNGEYQYLCEFDPLPQKKILLNDIEMAIFIGSDAIAVYLKNGLSSARMAKKFNLIGR